jgi:hypothetical protein
MPRMTVEAQACLVSLHKDSPWYHSSCQDSSELLCVASLTNCGRILHKYPTYTPTPSSLLGMPCRNDGVPKLFLNCTNNCIQCKFRGFHYVRVHVACNKIVWNVSVPCINTIKGTSVTYHFFHLYVIVPLPHICIHSKRTTILDATHIIYPRRALDYPELLV